jgi:radical SAM protein with 4Fe4S-binding SPASM domain
MFGMVKSLTPYIKVYMAKKLKQIKLRYQPIQVTIEPTNVCNFTCSFCNQNDPDHFSKRQAGRIDIQDYEIILDKIKNSCLNLRTLSLTLDGEPTLHKDFPEMIKKANEKGFFVRFSSNGTRIDRAFLEKTRNLSYLISVDFSIDKDGFEKYRGNNGSWSLVNKNLKMMVDYLSVNKNLYLEIFENSAYYDGLNKARANLKRMKECFGKIPRLIYDLRRYHKLLNEQSHDASNNGYYGCYYPWTSLNVAWNGDVVTCCRDLDGKYNLGNILQSSIEEIWNGQKYLHLRDSILKQRLQSIPSCRSCDLPYDSQRNSWDYTIQKIFRKW